ncbi:hypothetical protein O181_062274 [Austropuccinia psidii MF-1]|uniref:Uncharacterized protein n=1 Tax=Austropuccinia psidii MF-1 TaxID=1389203 RepID=A0A9Q3EK25_9BASI|nr:hypothetical protein [Austropuccinia psidii MF-1]
MNFAPYAPPPDAPRPPSSTSTRKISASSSLNSQSIHKNPWSSYQQGSQIVDPTLVNSYSSKQNSSSVSNHHSSTLSAPLAQNIPHPAWSTSGQQNFDGGRAYPNTEAYETRFGWRVDVLAAMAYLTPLWAIVLLITETRNDFVRIHAYQSLLLAIPLAGLHFLFLSSHVLQVLLLTLECGLYGWLGFQAYCAAETLERNLLPIIGPISERWTMEE